MHFFNGLCSKIKRHQKCSMNVKFSFIDGSGELMNLKMSSKKNEIPLENLDSLLFEFSCLDVKIVKRKEKENGLDIK